jgi:hypothetical protein
MVRRVNRVRLTLHELFGIFSSHRLRVHLRNSSPLTRHNEHRYDARLLLDALPSITSIIVDHDHNHDHTASNDGVGLRPDSPGGWSDLPSDAEDTFFLTPDETADLHRTKRLRHLDALRTARLRALSPSGTSTTNTSLHPDAANADPWGGSDEEVKAPNSPLIPKSSKLTRVV